MPKWTVDELDFGRVKRQRITANFDGRWVSFTLPLTVAAVVHGRRHPDLITHSLRDLIAQRLYAPACGYEDLNDHAQYPG